MARRENGLGFRALGLRVVSPSHHGRAVRQAVEIRLELDLNDTGGDTRLRSAGLLQPRLNSLMDHGGQNISWENGT